MLFIKSFYFCFSIRLGSIIVGVAYIIEAFVTFVLSIFWVAAPASATEDALRDIVTNTNLFCLTDIIHRIYQDPSPFCEIAVVVCFLRLVYCILMTYGAYYMMAILLLPFLIFEFIKLIFLIFLNIIAMKIFKVYSQSMGLLILASVTGYFFFIFLLYNWACVYSLFLVLQRMKPGFVSKTTSKKNVVLTPEFPLKLYPAYKYPSIPIPDVY